MFLLLEVQNNLTIFFSHLGFSVKRLSAFIKKYVMKAQLTEDNKAELTYQLPDFGSQTDLFIRLFRELELSHEGLGISSFGISDTSLEEVYIYFFFIIISLLYAHQHIKNRLESGPVTADLTTTVVYSSKLLINNLKPNYSLI